MGSLGLDWWSNERFYIQYRLFKVISGYKHDKLETILLEVRTLGARNVLWAELCESHLWVIGRNSFYLTWFETLSSSLPLNG